MTAALDAIRGHHHSEWVHENRGELDAESYEICGFDMQDWPCDAMQLLAALDDRDAALRAASGLIRNQMDRLAALDRAEAVVGAARDVRKQWDDLTKATNLNGLFAALRAYEDADKVADG